MKKLVLTALAIAGLSQATGCIISDDDPRCEECAPGTMSLAWTITANDQAATCAQVGAAEVELLVTDSVGDGTADQWPCTDMQGTTFPLIVDDYTIVVSLLDPAEEAIFSFPSESGVPVTEGADTDLGLYNFDLEILAPVTVSLYADYGNQGAGPTENCDETAAGGQGVVQQEIWLFDAGSQTCLDATPITNAFGTGDACGGVLVCTNIDEANTVELLPGDYDVQLIGLKGAVGGGTYPCYDSGVLPLSVSDTQNAFDVNAPFSLTADPRCDETKRDTGATK